MQQVDELFQGEFHDDTCSRWNPLYRLKDGVQASKTSNRNWAVNSYAIPKYIISQKDLKLKATKFEPAW